MKTYTRRIHMDFHTPELEPPLMMEQFDPVRYVAILKEANVESLVSFTKCHHGNMYYNTKIGHKHTGLPADVDMFAEILNECHRNNIHVLAYYSVGWLTTIQKEKPLWVERNIQQEMIGTSNIPTSGPWACICLNSPYLEEVVIPEVHEIVKQYEIDGLWFDIIENNPCYCKWCREKYKKVWNKPFPKKDEFLKDFVLQTKLDFMTKLIAQVKSIKPDLLVTYNTAGRNEELVPLVDFNCIETHPGFPEDRAAWVKSLLTYKFLQKYNKSWESCTSRFIHGWGGWDEQPLTNMQTVSARIIAHGGTINLGDQAYPQGTLDEDLYKIIGENYNFIKKREQWTRDGEKVPYIAILTTKFDIYALLNENYLGAVKSLAEHHWHFDVIGEECLEDLSDYKCLILPEIGRLKPKTIETIKTYVLNGGCLLATGNSSLDEGLADFELSSLFACHYVGDSEQSTGYLQVKEPIQDGIRCSPLLFPEKMINVKRNEKAEILCERLDTIIEPDYPSFQIFRHPDFAPPGEKSQSPGIISSKPGKGRVAYVAGPIFTAFWKHSQWYLSDIVNNVLKQLIINPLIELKAPRSVEMNLSKKGRHIVVHLINYHLQNETFHVREICPVKNLELKIHHSLVAENPPVLMPENIPLKIEKVENGMIFIMIETLDLYSQVVFERRS